VVGYVVDLQGGVLYSELSVDHLSERPAPPEPSVDAEVGYDRADELQVA
jgi:hypothetical protein